MRIGASRRDFLLSTTIAGLAAGAGQLPRTAQSAESATQGPEIAPPFKISLAEWSLHRALRAKQINNLDFPRISQQDFAIDAVEYVSVFFDGKGDDQAYLQDLKGRCDSEGVRSVLIMVDGEGALGDTNADKRTKAIENHYKWVEAAKFLGCHSIRVNAQSSGTFEEQQKLAADGLSRLGEFASGHGINVIVENHGGLSSCGVWLAGVMKIVNRPNVGTLPDFGNFRISSHSGIDNWYDKYLGVEELMPFAKAVSAKSHVFDSEGNESEIDYVRMMKIVLDAGYHGYVGIEWEGNTPDEYEGIRLTKRLLEKVRGQLA